MRLRSAVLALSAMPGSLHAAPAILYRFMGSLAGTGPSGPLVQDASGTFYGATQAGGTHKLGTIFALSPPAKPPGPWTETTLYDFDQTSGFAPLGGVTLAPDGSLFGSAYDGGMCTYNCGTAFRLAPPSSPGGAWTYTVLLDFGGAQSPAGGGPDGPLLQVSSAIYVGTTYYGGNRICSNNPGPCGTVFELTNGASGWTEQILYSFGGPPDGEFPYGGVIADAAGRLYGAASQGGTGRCTDGEGGILGCGTIFRLENTGHGWTETTLYDFTPAEQNGPNGPLIFGHDGALYGTAGYDVFRLVPPASGTGRWTKQTIATLTEGIRGTTPSGGLIADASGTLYGTSTSSGLSGFGSVFKLVPPSTAGGAWTLTMLARFGHGFNGQQPYGGLLIGRDGRLYGATQDWGNAFEGGTIFALKP